VIRRITLLIVAAIFVMALMAPAAFANHRGTPHGQQTVTPTECRNQGGNLPKGQQPECQGEGLTQESEVRNRGGNAPPGQQ
jgi:hypothetical protein